MIDLEPLEQPGSKHGDSMCITSTAAQMPFDYGYKQMEINRQENEAKGIEPFHAQSSGLSLYFQNSSVGDRLNFKERSPALQGENKTGSINSVKRNPADSSKFITEALKSKKTKDYFKKKTIEIKSPHNKFMKGSKRSSFGSIEEFGNHTPKEHGAGESSVFSKCSNDKFLKV